MPSTHENSRTHYFQSDNRKINRFKDTDGHVAIIIIIISASAAFYDD
jgi:hypothetical protein